MAVRKKIPQDQKPEETRDTISLARHLTKVREAIQKLPTDEQEQTMTTENQATETTKAATKKAPKKKVAAKAEKKAAKDDNTITLSEIAKSVKMEPRRARRILRNSDVKSIEVEGQRWTWKKGSPAAAKVAEILKAADAE